MSSQSARPIVVIGGGPAGSTAALTLRKLGHDVIVFEKFKFPRYRIGESLLPGTCSILTRLGVFDRIEAAKFTVKRTATFIWGGGRPPWSFTFSTPKTAPWVFDHAYQVTRAEYDQILLDAAAERGAAVRQETEVTGVELGENGAPSLVKWKRGEQEGTVEAGWIIDASGARGIVAQQLNLRRYDKYYKNMAVWSYFKGGKRFKGDLEGNIFSATWKEGWMWIIPLKDDVYSVGVVTGVESNARIREVGPDAFYHEAIGSCALAVEILGTATQCDEVRVLREWSYESKELSHGRAFLCGDSGCFIDPLFSSGVHLATYSATLAAAAIDHLNRHPEDEADVRAWYDHSYRNAYLRYHKFVAGFYACNDEPNSKFWSARRIDGAKDQRFDGKEWFTALSGQTVDSGASGVEEVEEGAAALAELWQHGSQEISDRYDDTELSVRRLAWAAQLTRQFNSMSKVVWTGREVRLVPSFKVHPTTFTLEPQYFLGDETGRTMTAYAVTPEQHAVFASLQREPLSYAAMVAKLKPITTQGTPYQILGRLHEQGMIRGYDASGQAVHIRQALRFGGVGSEDDIS
ncbi:MAG TPA: NAD(P)/FAD-dependent oxidoreductase [Vicinamibacterales bacterium]|nr:NAD(P)/FAD-dependent oxidoreductase [Vicinamibacterales bacterium]